MGNSQNSFPDVLAAMEDVVGLLRFADRQHLVVHRANRA